MKIYQTFHYHNLVILAVTIIASETDFECPYFDEGIGGFQDISAGVEL